MIDLEKLANQNKLLIENELIYVLPINTESFKTYQIKEEEKEKCLKVTLEEYLGLKIGYFNFNEELTALIESE